MHWQNSNLTLKASFTAYVTSLTIGIDLQGVTQAQIQSALNLKPEECLTLVNTLLQKELIDVLSKGSELVIKEKDAEMAVK